MKDNRGFKISQYACAVLLIVSSIALVTYQVGPADPKQFAKLVEFLRTSPYTDQLLTASNWLHISWNPFTPPRNFIRIGYYK